MSSWHRVFWQHPDLHARLLRRQHSTDLPVTLAEIVAHLRLDPGAETGPEAAQLERMGHAATNHLERYCSSAVLSQEWTLTLHAWPPNYAGLELPIPPFDELLDVTASGTTIPVADFVVERDERRPATIYPVNSIWPTVTVAPLAISITWRAGHADADAVPEDVKQAILLCIAAWYENREALTQFTLTPMTELGWESLLGPYRQAGFA